MEQQKQSATPREVEMPRPDLYWLWSVHWINGVEVERVVGDGVQLRKDGYSIIVRKNSHILSWGDDENLPVGAIVHAPLTAPKYTGPLTPELLANILIYG